jgi:ABC-2 type transport system ATP-binding protein
VIKASGLTKKYGQLTAVDRLDLTVNAGEIFGFLGPNGAGKTTTIKMLVGLLAPTSGTAHICGINVAEDPVRAKAQLGYVSLDTPGCLRETDRERAFGVPSPTSGR